MMEKHEVNRNQTTLKQVNPKDFQPAPTEVGTYWGREIALDFIGQEILGMPRQLKVVSGVPNERGHKLLVETGCERPHHRSLNCYRWGPPSISERERMQNNPLWQLSV